MLRPRPFLLRCLRFYRGLDLDRLVADDDIVHARSRFRGVDDPDCFAVYEVRQAPFAGAPPSLHASQDHTLVAEREFRRVPLDASGLALVVFNARAGCAVQVIAALGQWVEHAVSLYQPTYLLCARSLEQPRLTALLTGVRERRALQSGRASPFSVDLIMPELGPLLDTAPEHYEYWPDGLDVDAPGAPVEVIAKDAV
ncbi:MAG: hypothetical protein DME08_02020 [Candidatus Rokuibacteriota bacterium]|nr:MAG: hypothetical protein DME08_02020 [Candidatus Rokubacteria bacterium]PYO00886.1 MAG: hypothetical protein DMD89_06845 [Candidatus Rokubacteria bacterium]